MKTKLERFLYRHFLERGWTWSLKGRGTVQPTEEDIKAALDAASAVLYDENIGDSNTLQMGRLIILKNDAGLDVYVLAGTIEPPNPEGEA